MKRPVLKLMLVMVFLPFLSCNQHTYDDRMLPVTTKSDSAAYIYFQSWDMFHYDGIPGINNLMKSAIEQDSNFFAAYVSKAWTYYGYGMKEEYKEAAEAALKIDIQLNKAEKVSREILEARLSDYEADVSSIAQKYVDLYPDIIESYINAAYYYGQEGKYEKVDELAQKAIDLDPSEPSPYVIKGYAMIELGKYQEAEVAFKKYQELLPDAPNVYDCLGDLYMAMEDYDKAYDNFLKLHELGWGVSKAIKAKELMDLDEVIED